MIYVDEFEYKTGLLPRVLNSGGIGPCCVVGAIYQNKGYMAHVPAFSNFKMVLRPLFIDLQKDVKEMGDLQIFVAGGEQFTLDMESSLDSSNEMDMLLQRDAFLEAIIENGYEDAIKKVQWCKPDYWQVLQLVLSESRAEFDEGPVDSQMDEYEQLGLKLQQEVERIQKDVEQSDQW